jgi:hypothetical protein
MAVQNAIEYAKILISNHQNLRWSGNFMEVGGSRLNLEGKVSLLHLTLDTNVDGPLLSVYFAPSLPPLFVEMRCDRDGRIIQREQKFSSWSLVFDSLLSMSNLTKVQNFYICIETPSLSDSFSKMTLKGGGSLTLPPIKRYLSVSNRTVIYLQ